MNVEEEYFAQVDFMIQLGQVFNSRIHIESLSDIVMQYFHVNHIFLKHVMLHCVTETKGQFQEDQFQENTKGCKPFKTTFSWKRSVFHNHFQILSISTDDKRCTPFTCTTVSQDVLLPDLPFFKVYSIYFGS
jgi:hypothetical protein